MDYITAFIEVPKGSRNKYEYNHETGRIFLDRMLFSSVQYPADYGFIPETLAEDGDELDILVLAGEPTFPGCYLKATPVAMLEMWDERSRDEKILAISWGDPVWGWIDTGGLNGSWYRLLEGLPPLIGILFCPTTLGISCPIFSYMAAEVVAFLVEDYCPYTSGTTINTHKIRGTWHGHFLLFFSDVLVDLEKKVSFCGSTSS